LVMGVLVVVVVVVLVVMVVVMMVWRESRLLGVEYPRE